MFDRRFGWGALAGVIVLAVATHAHALTYAAGADNIAYLPVHQMGYTGSGVIVGVVDIGAPQASHPTFYVSDSDHTSRVAKILDFGDIALKNHPTSVAGIMAGRGPGNCTYLGVAPEATIWAAGTDGSINKIKAAFVNFATPDAQGKTCKIVGMSLGVATPDNSLDPFVMFLDYMAQNKGMFISVAAGNDPDEIWIPGGNFNLLTVGGLTKDLMSVSPSSGTGPTEFYARCKPDVVAPSTNMYLPVLTGYGTWTQGSGSYTSNSAPFGAATAALLKDYSDASGATWDPRVIKAIIMNSATKLPGWSHTSTQPLDDAQGAGRINALHSLYQYMAGEQDPGNVELAGWDVHVASTTAQRFYHLTGTLLPGSRVVATLAWFRTTKASNPDNLVASGWSVQKFEGLDLYLYADSDCSIVDSSVSVWDSVEHIYFTVDEADCYTLGVRIVGTGVRTETYGLAWFVLVPGDANWDGKVDSADLAIWQQNYDPIGSTPATWEMGDWNSDGKIDSADLALWQQSYDSVGMLGSLNAQFYPSFTQGVVAVPEPATLTLLAIGFLGGAAGVRRRR